MKNDYLADIRILWRLVGYGLDDTYNQNKNMSEVSPSNETKKQVYNFSQRPRSYAKTYATIYFFDKLRLRVHPPFQFEKILNDINLYYMLFSLLKKGFSWIQNSVCNKNYTKIEHYRKVL